MNESLCGYLSTTILNSPWLKVFRLFLESGHPSTQTVYAAITKVIIHTGLELPTPVCSSLLCIHILILFTISGCWPCHRKTDQT